MNNYKDTYSNPKSYPNSSSIDLAYGPSGLSESNGAFSIHADRKINGINLRFLNLKIFLLQAYFILSTIFKDSVETIYSVILSTMSV